MTRSNRSSSIISSGKRKSVIRSYSLCAPNSCKEKTNLQSRLKPLGEETASDITCTSVITQTKPLSERALTRYCITPQQARKKRKHKFASKYRPRKIVVIGDMHCGKSCLVSAYCSDQFMDMYIPTLLHCLATDSTVQGKRIDIIVVDTPGRRDYLPLRQVAYSKADLIMICFAVDCPNSLTNVEEIWVPEVKKYACNVPYILVGNRRDVRDEIYAKWCCCPLCQDCSLGCNKGRDTLKRIATDEYLQTTVITYNQGLLVAQQTGASAYKECSARYRDNTRQVFETATEFAVKKHRRKRKNKMRGPEACTII